MKKRLIAVVISLALCGVAVIGFMAASKPYVDSVISSQPVWDYPDMQWYRDFGMVEEALESRVEQGDNPRLMLGSSEFSDYLDGIANPNELFDEANYGFHPMCIGRGYMQSLWHAVEVGGLDDQIPDKKVVLFTSMNWFCGYQEQSDYKTYFDAAYSQGAYDALMANSDISDETKAEITAELEYYGVDVVPDETFAETIDDFVSEYSGDVRIAYALLSEDPEDDDYPWQSLTETAYDEVETPDWDDIKARILEEAHDDADGNELTVNDDFMDEEYTKYLKRLKSYDSLESDWNTTEIKDFELFLKVCKECDIEPLVIILPVNGQIWDNSRWTADVRSEYFDMISDLCEEYGVEYMSGQEFEYQSYAFRDACHPGWIQWLAYDERIYDFFMD